MTTKNKRLVPAVGYARRSSANDSQETSIPDQIAAVESYAPQHGYKLLRWYKDDAISGDDTENREEFKRMRDDAQDRGDFEAILCWNQDRFGRFDQIEAGWWIHPLRKAGVYLVTCDMGRIDWESPEGQLIYNVNQMGKHKFLKDHSANVVRGQSEAAKKGSWLGSIPYAYRLVGPKKDKKFVLDDPAKVAIVRRIYREWVDELRSLSEIAARLNAEGVVPPSGPRFKWRYDSVKTILINPAYCGDVVSYRYSYGKYHQVHGAEIVKGGRRQRNPEKDWVIRRDRHEAIVDRDTWEKAQDLIAKNKTNRGRRKEEDNAYVFSGLLRCGKCGGNLNGVRNCKGHQYYKCCNSHYRGPDFCDGSSVREDRLLRELAQSLMDWLEIDGEGLGLAAWYGALKPEDVPEAFAKVRKLIVPPPRPKSERKLLEKEHKQLTDRIATARSNLVLLDPENIPAAQETIRQFDARRLEIDKELSACKPRARA
jgi:DNA invertase Pin-like site-specific DNA recombinase